MKNSSIIICFLLFSNSIFSQELPNIIPPSPTAYELGKYGQIPVGMFTGTPNISVPLYTYSTKNLSVPISLSYNSNGIKVDQLSSNVGLGWSLNAGGVITRIIRDKPDEERGTFYPEEEIHSAGINSPMALDFFYDAANNNSDTETDSFMYNFMGYSGGFVFDKNKNILLTPQKDLKIIDYYENIGGVDKTGFKITDNKGVNYIFLDEEINITRTSGNGHDVPSSPSITAWYLSRIEHPKGDVISFFYEASAYFYTTGISESFKVATPTYQNGCPGYSGTGPGYEISPEIEFRLTIASKNLIKIKASHQELGEVSLTSIISHPEITGKKLISNLSVKDKNFNIIESFEFNYLSTPNKRAFLESVNFLDPQKKYQFEYIDPNGAPSRLSKSQDYWGYFNGKNNLYRFPNPQDDFINELIDVSFNSYNVGADKSIDPLNAEKGLLKKIKYPTKGYNEFEYESNSYYGGTTIDPPIKQLSLSTNTNEGQIGTSYDTSFTTTTIPYNQYAEIYSNVSFNSNQCDPFLDTGKSKATITITDNNGNSVPLLIQIQSGYNTTTNVISPTSSNHFFVELQAGKSYTVILHPSFECVNTSLNFYYYEQSQTSIYKSIKLGGLRIKKVKTFESSSNIENITRYYYGKKESLNISSGDKGQRPFYISKITNRIPCNSGFCAYIDQFYQSINSNSLRQLYNSSSNGTTYYKYVTVSHGGDNFENGGDEHEFMIDNDVSGNVLYGNNIESSPKVNIGWGNGLEKNTTVFKKSVENFINLKEVTNLYFEDIRNFKKVFGYTINKKFNLICTGDITYECTSSDLNKTYTYPTTGGPIIIPHPCNGKIVGEIIIYPDNLENLDIMEYSTNSYWHYLESTIEKQYDQNGQNPVTTTRNYFYDNPEHLQVTRTVVATSDGKEVQTNMYYPDDVISITSLGMDPLTVPEKEAIDKFKKSGQHHIAEPIQVETKIKDAVGTVLSETTQRTNYVEWYPNIVLPESIETLKGAYNATTNNTETRIRFLSYYPNGNVKEVSKQDGTPILYIWGYNQTLPIAKIENATYVEVQAALGDLPYNTTIEAIQTTSNLDIDFISEENLRMALDDIRKSLPNTQVTTYTYNPLIGVTSITDSRGETIYYEYDEFNRLKQVKDALGNILSKNEYHYKN